MSMLLDLRGSNTATVKDIINFTSQSTAKILTLGRAAKVIQERTVKMESCQTRMEGQMEALIQHLGIPEPGVVFKILESSILHAGTNMWTYMNKRAMFQKAVIDF